MTRDRFSQLVRRWVYRVSRPRRRLPDPARNFVRLALTECESRIVPTVIPIVAETRILEGNPTNDPIYTSVQAAIHPVNPLRMVRVSNSEDSSQQTGLPDPAIGIRVAFSNDGGLTWQNFATIQTFLVPTKEFPSPGRVSSPAVAIERDGYIYVVHLDHREDYSQGRIVVNSWRWLPTDTAPVQVPNESAFNETVYRWSEFDPAYNPTIGLPNSAHEVTDPDTGVTHVNTMVRPNGRAKAVYVAWNTDARTPGIVDGVGDPRYSKAGTPNAIFNPNAIYMASSSDRGRTFSSPTAISNTTFGYNTDPINKAAAPQIAFGPDGRLTFVWHGVQEKFLRRDTSRPDGGDVNNEAVVTKLFTGSSAVINDAFDPGESKPHIPGTTVSTITVTEASLGPTFSKLTDLDVEVAITHPDLRELSISLVGPGGNKITLVRNRLLTDGKDNPATNPYQAGLDNTKTIGGAIFSDQSPRLINDPAHAKTAYVGYFRPEVGSMAVFNGFTPSQLATDWSLVVVDHRASKEIGFINSWSMRMTSWQANDGFGNGPGELGESSFAFDVLLGGLGKDNKSPFTIPASPTVGVGPSFSVAYDTSGTGPDLGKHRGRLYVAYTNKIPQPPADTPNNTNIRLAWSDNSGKSFTTVTVNTDSPFDHFTEGRRSQFGPSVAVDPVTGQVSVMWYDARNDASNARVETFIASSVNGGATFGEQVSISRPKVARDTITNTNVTLETMPNNLAVVEKVGFGTPRLTSLLSHSGKLFPFWIGNDNENVSFVYTATVRTPIGPQILGGDMGPVVQKATAGIGADKVTYNNTFAADGTRQMDGFKIVFDRPIDPRTFQPSDVIVKFRGPGATGFDPDVVTIKGVRPVDGTTTVTLKGEAVAINAKTFFVEFEEPQSKVGTYSYAVGPNIRDFVRNPAGIRLVPPTGDYAGPDQFRKVVNKTIPDGGQLVSTQTLPAMPIDSESGQPTVIGDVVVTLNINHPNNEDLQIFLTAPNLTKIALAKNLGGSGDNYTNTRFDDYALVNIAAGTSPFSGTFRPAQPLAAFAGADAAGDWKLTVIDVFGNGFQGTLLDWTLTVLPGVVNTEANPAAGASIDQDGNSRSQETSVHFPFGNDVFAIPRPINGTPFELPYVSTTLPLIIPGPRLRPETLAEDNVTVNDGRSEPHAKLSNLVFNSQARTIDVTFDRDMFVPADPDDPDAATSFVAEDIIRLIGPTGVIYDAAKQPNPGITVAPLYDDPDSANPGDPTRRFQITLPESIVKTATFVSGQYSLEIGSNIKSASGHLLDTNMNAGLFGLIGGDPLAQPQTLADTATYKFDTQTPLVQFGTVSLPLTITDEYVIRQTTGRNKTDPHILVRMSVQHPDPQNLIAELVAPDGFRVRLFTGIGDPTSTLLQGFTGVFDDNASTPIQFLATEFPTEPVTPQQPISTLAGRSSKGEWRLEITDNSSKGGIRQVNSWGLTFPFTNPVDNGNFQGTTPPPRPGVPPVPAVNVQTSPSGLGEPIADRFTIGFRVFNLDPLDDTSRQVWVPVGPTSMNGQTNAANNAGRVNAVAVDPSDPSGNTVYIGAGSGGVWKTTNFLTTASGGPTWIPLTDFGPVQGMTISSIVLVPRNNDPNQTAVYALTGDGSKIGGQVASPLPGIGILRSFDAGRTWQVLDSTKNSTAPNADTTGTILPIDSELRNRLFFGTEGYKIVADPRPTPQGNILLYMAVGGNNPATWGVWRSRNGGDTWTRIEDRGPATDVVLAPATAGSAGNGNLERMYAAIQGVGVFTTAQAPNVPLGGMTLMAGGQGNPLIRDVGFPPSDPAGTEVPVNPPADTPNGPKGRITLAVPSLTDNPLQNTLYAGWLYALVSNAAGGFDGLYVTKDFGANWTKVRLPSYTDPEGKVYATNDESKADYSMFIAGPGPRPAQGNYNLSLTVDPSNPNIVFMAGLGSTNGRPQPAAGSMRVDITKINDPYTFVFWDNSAAGQGAKIQLETVGGAKATKDYTNDTKTAEPFPFGPEARTEGILYRPIPDPSVISFYTGKAPNNYEDFLNLYRDPDNPFLTPDTLRVFNVANFTNTGENAKWRPFTALLAGANDVHQITSYTDPLTGRPRYIYATDHGVFTGVADEKGNLIGSVGFAPSVSFSRNGNLQLAQFNAGAVQPSLIAADIAGALFYGMSRDNGFPVSTRDVLSTGDTNWNNPLGDPRLDPTGTDVAVDPTGSGTAFQYRWPGLSGPGIQLPTDFFRVFAPNTNHSGEGTSQTKGLLQAGDNPGQNQGQWPFGDERPVGHFAVNPYDAKGLVIGSATGQVFRTTNQGINWFSIGFPQSGSIARALAFGAPATPTSELNNFIYAGTEGGQVFVSYDKATQSFTGTFTAAASNISAGLDGSPVMRIVPNPTPGSREAFLVTSKGVYHAANVVSIAEGTAQWQNITGNLFGLTRAVFGETGKNAVATNSLLTITSLAVDWRVRLPQDPDDPNSPTFPPLYVAGDGGVFQTLNKGASWSFYPDATIDGAPVSGGYLPNVKVTDLDLAIGPFDPSTGKFKSENSPNLLLATTYGRGSFAIRLPLNRQSGPAIISVQNPTDPPSGPTSKIGVTFNQSIDPRTFDPSDVQLFDPDGNPVNVIGIDLATKPLPGQPDPQDKFWITFDSQTEPGFYQLVIGPDIRDISGEFMNQNRNAINGEDPDDKFYRFVYLNGVADSLVLTGLPNIVVAGESQQITVTATDKNGNVIPNYTGKITISNTDATATSKDVSFPITYVFTTGDAGSANIEVTFRKAGLPFQSHFVVAEPLTGPAINPGKIEAKVVAADPARIEVSDFPSPVIAGDEHAFFVTAYDEFDNIADKYRGTVTFSSSDLHPEVKLPFDYQFTEADAGKRQFNATLITAGLQSITATDVGSGFAATQSDILVVNAAADKLFLSNLPPAVTAGQQGVTFTVTAKDRFGNVAKDYAETVTFATTDLQAVTPGGVTFDGTTFKFDPVENQGIATIGIEFRTAGKQTVSVSAPSPVAGDSISTLVIPDVATTLAVYGFPSPVVAGTPGTFTVEARDKFGNTATGYSGTVGFKTTDPNPTLPANYTFGPGDKGKRDFVGVLKTVGTQSITVTDLDNPSITGEQTGIVVTQSFAGSFALTGLPVEVTAGDSHTYTITVLDANGKVSFGYLGTVTITSTDGQAIFQTSYTFTKSDYGVKTLPVEFRTAGGQSITVSEAAGSATPGTIVTTVLPAAASSFSVSGFPSPVVAGDTKTFIVKALDPFGNVATKYAGSINFTSSDPQAALPVDGKLINGIGSFAAILKTAGTQSIFATDTANPSITGSQVGIQVQPSVANGIFVSQLPATVSAGDPFGFTVTMKDVFGNIATGFTGDVKFASTDPQAKLPATYTFTAADQGVKAFTAEFRTAGPRNLTVTSTATGVNPGAGSTVVVPGAATKFVATALPQTLTAGEAATFSVTAKDQFGNVATGFAGTVSFSSTDPQAKLPAAYTFNPAVDQGTRTFGVTFFTAGSQSVTIASADGTAAPVTISTTVRPSITTSFEVTGTPTALAAGGEMKLTVIARDQFGNVDTGYAGTVRFASSDKQATLPPDATLSSGIGTFTITLRTAGSQTVSATATADPNLTGTVTVNVSPATPTRFDLTGPTGNVVAGNPIPVTVTARDQFGNVVTGYTGTVRLTSTDPDAILPPDGVLTNGMGQFQVVLQTAGTQIISAADVANPALSGSLPPVTVVLPPPPPNTPPRISEIPDQTTRLNRPVGPLTFTVEDDQSLPSELQVTVTTSNPDLFPASGITVTGTGATRTLTLVPAVGRSGSAVVIVTVQDPQGLTASESFTVEVLPTTGPVPPVLIGPEQFAVATDVGGSPVVRFFNPDATERTSFNAFANSLFPDTTFTGGVRVATADFNGDGIADIVIGTGPGAATFVRVLDGVTLQELFSITPFEPSFTGGVYVAAGDVTGNGLADLIITPDEGGGPRVRVFDGTTFKQIIDFFGIDDPDFRGGARAAVGDVNGDGIGDLIVAAGFQGGPRVAGYSGASLATGVPQRIFGDFFAFEQTLRNGVFLAVGDIDGDGFADIIAGGGPGGGPRITVFSGQALLSNVQQPIANFFGGDPDNRGGIRIAVKDLDDDNKADLIVGSGTGAGARVTAYLGKNIGPTGIPPAEFDFEAFSRFVGGVFVG